MFLPMATSIQVVFDCADPPTMALFWANALGYKIEGPPEPFSSHSADETMVNPPSVEP